MPLSRQQGVLKFFESDKFPHSCTVDEALARIPYERFNTMLMDLWDFFIKRKFFYNHPELMPDNHVYIGADGFWIHTYAVPHAIDSHGRNMCPYCLPRTHHKGTAQEFTTWIHVCVSFALICNGLTLPMYIYPLKAAQVNTNQTDAALKQECELIATRLVLTFFRKRYLHFSFVFLGDAFYANAPFIQHLQSFKFKYITVLKDNLKTLDRQCDDLSKTEFYQKFY